MRAINILLVLIVFFGCHQKEDVEIRINYIDHNMIYFSIQNNTKDSIQFLKPKHNYLCYEGNIPNEKSIYKGYFILNLMNVETKESAYGFTNVSSVNLNPYEISTYKKILIRKKDTYADSIMIPNKNSSECLLHPKIDENTVLVLIKDSVIYKSDLIFKYKK